jgi:hypothetical protein
MGDMADDALDRLCDEDEEQLRVLGTSNVFGKGISPLSDFEQWLMEGADDEEDT